MGQHHTALVDIRLDGHHTWYIVQILEALAESGASHRVTLITSDGELGSVHAEMLLSRLGGLSTNLSVELVGVDVGTTPADVVAVIRSTAIDLAPDHIVVLDADHLLVALIRGPKLPVRTSLQLMRAPEFVGGARQVPIAVGKAGLVALVALTRRVDRVALLRSPLWPLARPSAWLGRLAAVREQFDRLRSVVKDDAAAEEPTDLLVAGVLDHRKLLPELAAAIEQSFDGGDDRGELPRICLLGAPSKVVREQLDLLPEPVMFEAGFFSEERLDTALSSARFVWCVNKHDVSSGFSLTAIDAGCSIIALEGTRLGRIVEEAGLGLVVGRSPADMSSMLTSLANQPAHRGAETIPHEARCSACFAIALGIELECVEASAT